MVKLNKTKEIHLRLTEKEYTILKEKAKDYPSLSSYVIDACLNFDDELGRRRLNRFRLWSEDFHKFESELNMIGNNINQIAYHFNKMSHTGVYPEGLIDTSIKLHKQTVDLLAEIINSNIKYKQLGSHFISTH